MHDNLFSGWGGVVGAMHFCPIASQCGTATTTPHMCAMQTAFEFESDSESESVLFLMSTINMIDLRCGGLCVRVYGYIYTHF